MVINLKTEVENVNIIGGTFEDANKESDPKYNKYDKESREALLQKLLPRSKKILDLGCSIGAWGAFFKKIGFEEIYGVDISEERLKVAKSRGYKTFKSHGSNLPFDKNSFDAVVCLDVLVHTIKKEDRFKTISEAARVLKPGGAFVFSIANKKFEDTSKKVNFYLPAEKRETCYYCAPIYLDEAIEAVEKQGLKVVDVRGLQFMLPSFLVKFPALLKCFDVVFQKSFLKKYARVIFIKAVK